MRSVSPMAVEIFAFIFAGFIILAIIIGYFSHKRAEERRNALSDLARELGFDFYPYGFDEPKKGFWASLTTSFEDTRLGGFLTRFQGFEPFGYGHSYEVNNLLVGSSGDLDWYIFDYKYETTESTKDGSKDVDHHYGVIAARLPVVLPVLSLTPENLFHKVGQWLGDREITFELEEFNRRYFVRCPDRKGAFDLLHPQAIDFLMRQPVRHWQFGGMYIVMHQPGEYNLHEIGRIKTEIEELVQLIPDYVIQDRGFTPRWSSALE